MADHLLALFGDSILDNGPYTRPEPDTTAHLGRLLGKGWTVRRLATDGAMMRDVAGQLRALRERATVAVLSIGGNDAVEHIGMLEHPIAHSGIVLEQLDVIAAAFQQQYERVAGAVAERADRVILCTIYDVQLEPPAFAKRARVPLAVLNDRIFRTARRSSGWMGRCLLRDPRLKVTGPSELWWRRFVRLRAPTNVEPPCGWDVWPAV